jgi:hypothetical protein
VPQLSHVTFPNSVMTIKDYKALPSGVKCIVAVSCDTHTTSLCCHGDNY